MERFRAELGPEMKVIATGGLAEVIAKETQVIQTIAPWLTLDGLRIVWELNRTGRALSEARNPGPVQRRSRSEGDKRFRSK